MAVQIIITNAGRAALVNAANTGTNPVTITQIGLTATGFTPNASLTSLSGEFKRLSTMSGAVVADDTIHLTVRDESSETYNVRSFGLYLADGTLFAVYGQAALLVQKSSQSIMLLAVDIKFADIAAASLTFGNTDFLLPPATKTAQGVVELATQAETISGSDDTRAVTPKDNKTAFNDWLNSRIGSAAPSPLLKDILALALVEDDRLKRAPASFDMKLALGRPDASPECRVTVTGFKDQIDGTTWLISDVTHRLDKNGGLSTDIKMEVGTEKSA